MKHMNKIMAVLAALLILFAVAPPSFAAPGGPAADPSGWNSPDEVRRLNKEAPSLDSFHGAEALVWLANDDYRMRNDGAMEHSRFRVVMIGETVPAELADTRILVPYGGSVEIIDASWYNPMTAMKEGSLNVSEETLAGGAAVKRVSIPDSVAGRVVVIAFREVNPGKYGVDGVVPMAGAMPRWEQNLTVEADAGQELFWTGRDVSEPLRSKDGETTRYKWTVMNQQPWHGEGFVVYKRPYVAFGTKKGAANALAVAEGGSAAMKAPPLPAFAGSGDKNKNGLRLMSWIAEPSRTLQGYPQNWVRHSDEIPAQGPWTRWEQTIILDKWLRAIGWDSEIWWKAADILKDDTPAAGDIFVAPVLRVSSQTDAKKKVYYQAGQASAFGTTVPGVSGATLFRVNGKGAVEKKTVSAGSASDHRLSMLWKLRLNDDGTASGTLDVTAKGGWTELFSDGQLPDKKGLGDFLLRGINFALPGLTLDPKTVTPSGAGYLMQFNVTCAPGIVHGGNLLLRLPGGVPQRLGDMIGQESEYTFSFPFIIEQSVRMKMPHGYRLVQQPSVVNRGEGTKAVLKQSVTHWPKKAELLADSIWAVKTRDVDTGLSILLREELAAALRWPVLNLPFRK